MHQGFSTKIGASNGALPPSYLGLAMRCAELQADINARKKTEQAGSNAAAACVRIEPGSSGVFVGKELIILLKAACKQLEGARQVGGQLKQILRHS